MKHLIVKALFCVLILYMPGCGVWQNFTTYFNLYYNTADAFQMAEEAIYLQERSIFAVEDISVPASANQLLNRVVEKSSKILQFHGTTAFVDDALLMLGKSFYYQKNYLKAIRKFQELTATQQESDLYLEAILWIGKTQMRLKEFDDALVTFDSLRIKAADEGEDLIIANSFIEEIIYNSSRENYTEAIRLADTLHAISDDSEQQAEILYETANFYLKLNEPEKALTYLQQVEDYSPRYIVLINSLLAEGRTLRNLGRNEDALDLFESIRLEDKFRDNYDVIDYEIGLTYLKLDRIEEAVENLVYVDTSYSTSQYSGLARFTLGTIYENNILNFDSAAVYYQKAASSQLPADRVKEIHGRNQLFVKYGQITAKIFDTKKQIQYKENPEEFLKDSTVYFDSLKSLAIQDSMLSFTDPTRQRTDRQTTQRLQTQNAFRQKGPPQKSPLSIDSLSAVLLRNKFDLANLFFAELEKPDSAAKYYSEILNDTSAVEYKPRTMYALGNYYLTKGDSTRADSIFSYIYDNYKNDRVANAAALRLNKPLINVTADPAEIVFAEAERLWKEERYDTSAALYRQVYYEFPKSPFAPKALLAAGWIYENDLKIPDSAAVVFDTLAAKYPGTQYALKVSPKIIVYKQEQQKKQKAIEDSIRVANQRADSLKHKDQPVIAEPDSLSEFERLQKAMEKTEQDTNEVQIQQVDTVKVQQIKPDTLQPPVNQNQNTERRNPRRRK